jgi:hypothetical protein
MSNKQELINYIKSDKRICPMPQKWMAIFGIISSELPPNVLVPLILGAWNFTEDSEKQKRLIEQIEFAFSLSGDKFEKFEKAIYALNDADWYKGE